MKYKILEKIGEGGFGDVFRALRIADNFEVAMKVLTDTSNPDARHRFEREVRLLEAHQHPHIMKILDHDLHAKSPYYVMPLMKGGVLTQWAGSLPHENMRAVLRCLAGVLASLHVNGSLHRDLKPDNILVDGDGRVALGDFGLGNNPRYTVMFTVSAAGTPGYAAPELMMYGGEASFAADVYSLGATLFHVITGVHPSKASSLDPRPHRPDVPADLRDLLLRMTQRDPALRPSAQQLCEQLGVPVPTRKHTAPTGGFTPRQSPTVVAGGRYA